MVKFTVSETSGSERGTASLSCTVCSTFGGDYPEVTLKLQDPASGNTFYDKHVMRRGEDPEEVLKLRNSMKKNRIDTTRVNFASSMEIGLKESGVSGRTVIILDNIDHKNTCFIMANTLINAYENSRFPTLGVNVHVTLDFEIPGSVCHLKKGATKPETFQTIIVGAQLNSADDDDGEYTFSINHAEGPGRRLTRRPCRDSVRTPAAPPTRRGRSRGWCGRC